MGWLQYLLALLLFNALGGLALFALLMRGRASTSKTSR
jgi:K+-transporting ATPase ATPase A chain